jgi:hypothetical protein
MPISLSRIVADKLLDELITDITVKPMWSGDALVSDMAAGRLHYAWYWWETNQLKVLDDDLFDEDPRKDAGTGAVWDTPAGLACLVAHTTAATGTGASARLFGGTMAAPWITDARENGLKQLIDVRATTLIQEAIQGLGGGTVDQETLAALQVTVGELEGRVNALQAALDGLRQRVGQAGAALVGG